MGKPPQARGPCYALLGQPVDHSRSPALYRALFDWAHIDARYITLDLATEEPHTILAAIRDCGLAGANLTAPLKERVIPALDGLSSAATRSGAVNVIVPHGGGWVGHNTDGAGLVASLRGAGVSIEGRSAIVLGAGGAGRGVASALIGAGAQSLVMLNRTEARAAAAVRALRAERADLPITAGPLRPDAFTALAESADLVVNCTAGAGAGAVAALDVGVLGPGAVWVDINYWMPDPPQAQACRAADIAFHTGHAMLLHQGLLAFALFTGRVAPPEIGAAAVEGA